jgi:CheY-like chemotaxis protein
MGSLRQVGQRACGLARASRFPKADLRIALAAPAWKQSHQQRAQFVMQEAKRPGPLLIVDDSDDIRSALCRLMSLCFERVVAAATPQEAEAALRAHQPRLLLCDYWLGPEHPPATDLIPGWRERYPSIERVALITGTNTDALGSARCVDAVFQKPLDMHQVTDFLLRSHLGPAD